VTASIRPARTATGTRGERVIRTSPD